MKLLIEVNGKIRSLNRIVAADVEAIVFAGAVVMTQNCLDRGVEYHQKVVHSWSVSTHVGTVETPKDLLKCYSRLCDWQTLHQLSREGR